MRCTIVHVIQCNRIFI